MNKRNIIAVMCLLGKETLGYTDPPAINLNKIGKCITDFYTSVIIAVIDNVAAQLTWQCAWSQRSAAQLVRWKTMLL